MENNNFKNKIILITGISGFVGKSLAKRLDDLGAVVFGISKSSGDNEKIFKLDVLNKEEVDEFIKGKHIQMCFHLAGESLVESGQTNPYSTFRTNIEGTLNVLESSRKNNLEKIIIASTAHVYGDNKTPYLEEYAPHPSRPYETSKACIDLIAQSYADNFSLPVFIPRFANIYGPGDLNFSRLIPKTMMSVLAGKNPQMWGGNAIRDYIYIEDAIDAFLSLASMEVKQVKSNRIYNFGSGDKISVKDLIEKIIAISKKNLSVDLVKEERKGEIIVQYVSTKKAEKDLGFEAKYSLDKGLKQNFDWYKSYTGLELNNKHIIINNK